MLIDFENQSFDLIEYVFKMSKIRRQAIFFTSFKPFLISSSLVFDSLKIISDVYSCLRMTNLWFSPLKMDSALFFLAQTMKVNPNFFLYSSLWDLSRALWSAVRRCISASCCSLSICSMVWPCFFQHLPRWFRTKQVCRC